MTAVQAVPEGRPVHLGIVVCRRCRVGSRELHCWNCGLPYAFPGAPLLTLAEARRTGLA